MSDSATLGIDTVQAGSMNSAYAMFEVAAATADGAVSWSLQDEDGRVYNSGSVSLIQINPHPFKTGTFQFRAEAEILVPANIPVNNLGTKYQIKWTLLKDGVAHHLFDTLRVVPSTLDRLGILDQVELVDTPVRLQMLMDTDVLHSCNVYVYRENTEILSQDLASLIPNETTDGFSWYFDWEQSIANGIGPSVNPYTVMFKYRVTDTDPLQTHTGQLWIVNPSILDASRNIEQYLNAAYQDAGLQPFATLDNVTLMAYLRKGMDQFNGVVRPTNFTMLNAAGPIRHFWLGYSMVNACRSQQLAEGLRAFNYSGASISLDVDRTQYWEQMASSLASDLDQQVKPFKDMLNKYGIFGGDGSAVSPSVGSIGAIGIRLSPLTPLRTGGFRYPGVFW